MIVMTFDLSSTCIGVSIGKIENKDIALARTMPIIPKRPTGKDVGYTTAQPKKIAYRGNEFKGFLKPGEFSISKSEAERRRAGFKVKEHNHLLRNIGKQCGHLLKNINPDVVCIERNSSFNGILTTKLLAEIAGGLYFYCGANDIPLFDYNEATVRALIRRTVTEFSYENESGEKALDTKWEIFCRLREYFKNVPGLDFSKMTLDESDSLAILFYYYETEVVKK